MYDTSFASCGRNLKFKELVKKETLIDQVQGMAYALYYKYSSQFTNIAPTDIPSSAKDIGEKFFPYFGG